MSLINEALKRAEADKLQRSPFFDNLTVLPPAENEVPPPPRPDIRPRRKRSVSILSVLSGLMLAGAAGGAVYLWLGRGRQPAPRSAAAAGPARPAPAPTRPKPPRPPAASLAATTPPAPATAPAKPEAPGGALPSPAPESRPAVAAVDPPRPTTAPAVEIARAPSPETAPTSRPAAAPKPAAAPAIAAARPSKPKATVVKPRPAPRRLDVSKLRLQAIMRGPGGNVALINGNCLREGQTVEGARIVKIGQVHVELECDGQRASLRM